VAYVYKTTARSTAEKDRWNKNVFDDGAERTVCTITLKNNRVLSRRLKLSVISVGKRRSSLSEFQAVGRAAANARRPYELRLCRGTTRWWRLAERRCRRVATLEIGVQKADWKWHEI